MDELRKLLKEGKLTIRQYLIVAYELFKEMIKNDNKEIIVLYVLYLATVFFAVSQNPLFGMLTGIVTLVAISRIWLLYNFYFITFSLQHLKKRKRALLPSFISTIIIS